MMDSYVYIYFSIAPFTLLLPRKEEEETFTAKKMKWHGFDTIFSRDTISNILQWTSVEGSQQLC